MVKRRLCLVVQKEARKAFRKVMKASRRVDSALTHRKKVQAVHKGKGNDQKGKGKEGSHPHSGFSVSKTQLKWDKAVPGNQTTGIAALLTIPHVRLLNGLARDILHGWHQSLCSIPTIKHTFFWILAALGQLDRERQSEGSRNMRCIVVLRQNSVLEISILCLPTLRQKLVG